MKKFFLAVCLMLAGLCATAGAQMNKSEYARKAAEKLARGDRAGAIAILDKAIEQRKDLDETYAMRGHLRLGAGDLDGAIADFTEAIKLTPNNAKLYEVRASFRGFKRDYAGALQDYDAAIAHGLKTEKVYVGRGRIRHDMGDVEGAIADYRFAVALNPMNASAQTGLAWVLERKGEVEAARVQLQDFLDRYEGKRSGKLSSAPGITHTGEGVPIKREGKEADGTQVTMGSSEFVTTSEVNSPTNAAGQEAKLEQQLNLAHAYATLGRLYAQGNEFERALENYEKGLKINKTDPYLYKLRSESRIKRGDLQGAIDDLTIVVNSRMGGAPSNLDKGLLLLLQGREAEAEKEFALHLQTYPGSKEYLTRTVEEAKRLRSNQPQQ